MAAIVVVSSRIDEATASRVAARIKASGLTVGEVIKRVQEQIAQTGEIPRPCIQSEENDALFKLHSLQARLGPMPDSFNAMTKEQMRDLLGDRDV